MFVFELSGGILLAKGLPPMALQLNRTFISEDHILETLLIFQALVHPNHSLCFIGIPDGLAVP